MSELRKFVKALSSPKLGEMCATDEGKAKLSEFLTSQLERGRAVAGLKPVAGELAEKMVSEMMLVCERQHLQSLHALEVEIAISEGLLGEYSEYVQLNARNLNRWLKCYAAHRLRLFEALKQSENTMLGKLSEVFSSSSSRLRYMPDFYPYLEGLGVVGSCPETKLKAWRMAKTLASTRFNQEKEAKGLLVRWWLHEQLAAGSFYDVLKELSALNQKTPSAANTRGVVISLQKAS